MCKRIYLLSVFLFVVVSFNTIEKHSAFNKSESAQVAIKAPDHLLCWNEGTLKKYIIAYVKKVTTIGSQDFNPVENRIVFFDNWTLWAEKPYLQELFTYYRVKKMVVAKSSMSQQQPFKTVVEKDKAFFETCAGKALIQLVEQRMPRWVKMNFEPLLQLFFTEAKYRGKNVTLKKNQIPDKIGIVELSPVKRFYNLVS